MVEDDPNMGVLLEENLRMAGFEPTLVADGEQAVRSFHANSYDLCLLDIMLPKKDGLEVARSIRKLEPRAPFIFISARSMPVDKIEGFKLGADDYITKPFNLEVLMLRIRAVLNRTNPGNSDANVFQLGGLELNVTERSLSGIGEPIKVSQKEAALIRILAQNSNEVVSRADILKAAWGSDNYFNSKSLDVYLTKIRKYLKRDTALRLQNIHGYGYKLVTE